jgi:hypothetical protein
MRDKQNLMPRMTGAFKYYTLMISTKTIRKNIGKIDGSYINTPAGKYYDGPNNMSTPKANYLKFIQNVSKQKNARFNFALYHLFVRKSVQS